MENKGPNFSNFGDGMVWFVGIVTDVDDPIKIGRVRVKIFDWHDDSYSGDYPWCQPIQSITSAASSDVGFSPTGILVGSWVVGFFLDGNQAQRPVILGTLGGVPKDNAVRETRAEEPDTNRLARNDEKYPHDILEYKTKTTEETVSEGKFEGEKGLREVKVPIALSEETWDEPPTKYDAAYPKNHVYESESGHIREYDDTEEKERIHEFHNTGTFYEIDPEGTKVTHIVKDNYKLVVGDEYVKVQGNVKLYIDSNCYTYIKKDWNIQVDGNKTEVIYGKLTQTVHKQVTETYKSTLDQTVSDDVTETYGANQTTQITGNLDVDATRIDLN